jgi:hypothetical protein
MGRANEMNKKIDKKKYSDYVYVMLSTLNQMVNYIPLKYFDFKEVYNLTVKDDSSDKKNLFKNKEWDENLQSVYQDKTIEHLEIDRQNFFDVISIENFLLNQIENGCLKDKKIFWNITGGQRNFVLAINKVAKENDIICYLEGNNSQMLLYIKDNILKDPIEDYGIKDLTIEIALKLMGFQFNSENLEIGKSDERDFYKEFYNEYVKNKELREWLIILNKSYPKLRDKKKNENEESYKKLKDEYPNKKKEFEEIKKSAKDKVKNILSNLDQELLEKKLKRSQAFGYILEELAFYRLKELLQSLIDKKKVTLAHSLKIKNTNINNQTIAEFDIALLTDNGKFIMFECKSGEMTGDTAKARNYATYAVSGVYGLPILITPILSKEEDEELKDNILQDDYYDIYKNIKTAIASAQRAELEVWELDKIEDNLKKYIDL